MSPSPSTPSPSPSSSLSTGGPSPSSSSSGSGSPTANATLYLYTFLATLVLLLAVSSAIVIRSLILRRRHQRLVEEAIRTGTWTPNNRLNSTRRRRDIGQRPSLFEAWVNPDEEDTEKGTSEKRNWGDIVPVHAAYINPPAPSPQGSAASSAENPAEPPARPASRFMLPFTRRRPPPPSQDTAISATTGQDPSSPSSSPASMPASTVRVAVLIAMPDPSQKHHGDESGPPVVEIGLVEVNVKDDEIEINRDSS